MKKDLRFILLFGLVLTLITGFHVLLGIDILTDNPHVGCLTNGIRQEFSGLVVKNIYTSVRRQLQVQINDFESTKVYSPSKTLFFFVDKGDSLFKIKDRNECIVKKKNQNGYYLVQFSEYDPITEELPFPVDSAMRYNNQPVTVKILSGKEIEKIRAEKYSN